MDIINTGRAEGGDSALLTTARMSGMKGIQYLHLSEAALVLTDETCVCSRTLVIFTMLVLMFLLSC